LQANKKHRPASMAVVVSFTDVIFLLKMIIRNSNGRDCKKVSRYFAERFF